MKRTVLFSFCLSAVVLMNCQERSKVVLPAKDVVDSLMTEYHVPTVGISTIENGKLKHEVVYGTLPRHSQAPVNTFFNIASLTKPVTSIFVLTLVSRGQWDLDEPLFHYWIDPEVANDERHKKLTTRHVLSHQSGLPNWRGHQPDGKLAFAFEPGSQWKYSGEGFEYLRQAVEHKFNAPFEKMIDSMMFKPFGMNDTRFYWDAGLDTSLYANRHKEDGSPLEIETWTTGNPSNLLLTTVSDYARFGIAVMDHTGLTPEVYNEMITNQALLEDNREWGLGWRLIKRLSNGEYALVHTGGNPGLNTIIILLPQSKRGIVVFTNGAKGNQLYETLVMQSLVEGKEIVERMK